jgi:hypothetical protein
MKPEERAWARLREHAASQITPGFADRVLRAARAVPSPLIVSHFAMCAATAALCMVAVALYHAQASGEENASSLASWNEIAAQASDLEQGL